MPNVGGIITSAAFLGLAIVPAGAYDGWHLENAATIPSKTAAFDYITFDGAANRLFIGHRKEGLQVFDVATNKVVKVIGNTAASSSNGAVLRAILNVFEQVDADTYKPAEALGTRPMAKVLAYDGKAKKLYSMTAEAAADFSKKINTAVGPFYPNTFLPNTFTILTYSK